MKVVSSISTAAIAFGSAAPALAYVVKNNDVNAPTAVRTYDIPGRGITSRQVVRNFRKSPILGERSRTTAIVDDSGRVLLPVRNAWRRAGLRNSNRHLLGNRRGGTWKNARHYMQGDVRRSSVATNAGSDLLPPAIVQTGVDAGRPSRRSIRGNRDLNNHNRR